MTRRKKPGNGPTLIVKAAAGALTLAMLGASVFLALVIWDASRSERAREGGAPTESFFARSGSSYRTADVSMVEQSFPAEKAAAEFRVFVMGSSEAMGTPYVHQNFNLLSGRILGMPNEGGISTWLARYLERLSPGSRVVNAAMGGRDLRDSVGAMKAVLEVGHPDLIVLLDGNNEGYVESLRNPGERDGPGLRSAIDRASVNFERQLAEAAGLARERRIPLYVLTVPNNLRNWVPEGADGAERFARARALDAAGDYASARRAYIQAKDADGAFYRTRSRWNESIRKLASSGVRVIDMERILFGYAPDGIPGDTLFHDYCHMTLAANRIVAFELAKKIAADRGWSGPLALEDANLEIFTARQLRRLYLIKAFKWTRARWFGGGDSARRLNARSASHRYLDEVQMIDEQVGLLRPPPRDARRAVGP